MAPLPAVATLSRVPAFSGTQMFGLAVLGVEQLQNRLVRVVRFVEHVTGRSDRAAAEEMVSRMRGDVPRDTGRLYNGIGWTEEDGEYVVSAEAQRRSGTGRISADYGPFVERGTAAGQRRRTVSVVADSRYHAATAETGEGTTRRVSRRQAFGHPGTPAQPFFYDNAIAVLEERSVELDNVIGLQAAAEGDFQ